MQKADSYKIFENLALSPNILYLFSCIDFSQPAFLYLYPSTFDPNICLTGNMLYKSFNSPQLPLMQSVSFKSSHALFTDINLSKRMFFNKGS